MVSNIFQCELLQTIIVMYFVTIQLTWLYRVLCHDDRLTASYANLTLELCPVNRTSLLDASYYHCITIM